MKYANIHLLQDRVRAQFIFRYEIPKGFGFQIDFTFSQGKIELTQFLIPHRWTDLSIKS